MTRHKQWHKFWREVPTWIIIHGRRGMHSKADTFGTSYSIYRKLCCQLKKYIFFAIEYVWISISSCVISTSHFSKACCKALWDCFFYKWYMQYCIFFKQLPTFGFYLTFKTGESKRERIHVLTVQYQWPWQPQETWQLLPLPNLTSKHYPTKPTMHHFMLF